MVKINSDDIQKQIDKCMDYAKSKCDDMIIVYNKVDVKEIDFKGVNLNQINGSTDVSITIKPFLKNKTAIFSCNDLNTENIVRAIQLTSASKEIDYFPLEKPSGINKIDNSNSDLMEVEIEDMVNTNKKELENFDSNFKVVEASEKIVNASSIVATSAGVNEEWNKNLNVYYAEISKPEDILRAEYDYKSDLKPVDHQLVIENAKNNCDLYFDRIKEENLPKIVIIQDDVFLTMIQNLVLENLNGQNKLKENTAFNDNFENFDKDFNLKVFANESGWYSSRNIDSFGCATTSQTLIENGEIKQFLYDYNNAKKHGKKITGFSSLNDVNFANISVNGRYSEVTDAVVVEDVIGSHTMRDFLSGDFALKVINGFILRGGKKIALKNFMISGNIFEILRNYISIDKNKVREVSSEIGSIATDKIHISW